MSSVAPNCLWCGQPFSPKKKGGCKQIFCRAEHRNRFWNTGRAILITLIEQGRLTIEELREFHEFTNETKNEK